MIIGLDIDGVFADFNTRFIERIIAATGHDMFPPRPFDIPCWHYPQHYGYTEAEVSATWDTITVDPKFWQYLGVYDDTYAALKLLHTVTVERGDDVYFVTSRPGVAAKVQTERWLRCHGFPTPTVLLSSAKGQVARALKFDAYVDDRWENAVDVAIADNDGLQVQSTTRTFLVDRPWNRRLDDRSRDPQAFGLIVVPDALSFVRNL